jgi:predicted PurR-regulated permease PerM
MVHCGCGRDGNGTGATLASRRPYRLACAPRQARRSAPRDRAVDTNLQHKAFLLLLALVTVAFFWLLIPFYGAVFWAVILAIIFQPLHRALERRFGPRSNLAAFLSLGVCIVIAIIPVTLIVGALIREGAELVARLQSSQLDTTTILSDIEGHLPPWTQDWLERFGLEDWDELRDRLLTLAREVSQAVATRALSIGQNTLRFVASIGIMLYVLFFLFRDGRQTARNILAAMPLSDDYNRALIARFAAVVRATVKGNIVIAVIQGTIGGTTFWLLGVEGALLWGVLMTFLSLLPAVGSALVWVPTAVYLVLIGETWKAVILVVVGTVVIGLVDNLLRPKLVGKDTRLPDYVVLVSTVGGLSLFGINGFVIGPLIAALFVAAWTLFRDEKSGLHRQHLLKRSGGFFEQGGGPWRSTDGGFCGSPCRCGRAEIAPATGSADGCLRRSLRSRGVRRRPSSCPAPPRTNGPSTTASSRDRHC